MATETILNKNIEILPSQLDDNIQFHIYNKINKTFCNQELGYMLEVLQILNIESNPLLRGSNPSFNITYKAKVLKPEQNKILECKIKLIFSQGIIFEYGSMELLVPEDKEITLKPKEKKFVYKNKVFNVGDILKIKITFVKYESHSFKCLAKLI
jgi:DNA-directed RNA polymerase subunit E'/Rpb7